MAYLKLAIAIVVSGMIFLGGLVWLQPVTHPDIKHALAGELSSLNTLFLFLAMLAGSVAKALHAEAEKSKGSRISLSFFRRAFTSKSLFLSLVISPIPFLAVYRAAGLEPDRIVALLLSFQNGFFWKTILEGVRLGSEQG